MGVPADACWPVEHLLEFKIRVRCKLTNALNHPNGTFRGMTGGDDMADQDKEITAVWGRFLRSGDLPPDTGRSLTDHQDITIGANSHRRCPARSSRQPRRTSGSLNGTFGWPLMPFPVSSGAPYPMVPLILQ
jgi:hypothetical protein